MICYEIVKNDAMIKELNALNHKLALEMAPMLPEFLRSGEDEAFEGNSIYWEGIKSESYGCAMIAYDDTLPVGLVLVDYDHVAHVESLYVEPEYRRQGIARGLMDNVKQRVKSKGYTVMTLNVLNENKSGQQFYERESFTAFRSMMALDLTKE